MLASCRDQYEEGTVITERIQCDGSITKDTTISNVWTDVCMGDKLMSGGLVYEGGFIKMNIGDSLFVAPPPKAGFVHSVKRIK
jgi:hypothetical protein